MDKFVEFWKKVVHWAAIKGIPVPLLRNPRNETASVTFTMLVLTFVLCVLALIGRVAQSKLFQSIDFEHSFDLFIATSALYFGRNFQKGSLAANVSEKDKNISENKT